MSKNSLSILNIVVRGSWTWFTKPDLWAGFYPTLILGFLGFKAWQQVNQQINLAREQMAYVRKPIIEVRPQPRNEWPPKSLFWTQLFVSNVGNDTAVNFEMNARIYLVTESQVYSYGPGLGGGTYNPDTSANARDMIVGGGRLLPNAKREVAWLWRQEIYSAYQFIHDSDDARFERDLNNIALTLKGKFVLMFVCSYRRTLDYLPHSDTIFLSLTTQFGPTSPIQQEVGGERLLEKLRDYLKNGPEVSIRIQKDQYEIYHMRRDIDVAADKIEILQRSRSFQLHPVARWEHRK